MTNDKAAELHSVATENSSVGGQSLPVINPNRTAHMVQGHSVYERVKA